MKIAFHHVRFILFIAIIVWAEAMTAQTIADIKIDLEISNKPLKEVLTAIEQKSDLHFVYNDDLVAVYTNISVSSKNRALASVLNEILGNTNLSYIEQGNKIIIEKKDAPSQASFNAQQNEPAARANAITGVILEEGSERPVRNASIYFDGTLNGTTSDSNGNFTLDLHSTSKTQISITAVGYFPKVADYTVGTKMIIHLKNRTYELAAVEVTADDGLSRKDKLRLFRKEFLGDNDNAWNCEILNEDDIKVTYNKKKNILRASCDNPIVIRNKNLGYILNFNLQNFTSSDDGTFFSGTQFFKEDFGGADPKKIEKARKDTYLGSRMHFIRSLWNNNLEKSGFRVNRALGHQVYYENIVVEHDNQKFLNPTETLEIIYRLRKSYLYKNTLGKEIYIDKNGYNNPVGVNWAGAIGDERVGDSLPLEYGLLSADADLAMVNHSVTGNTLQNKKPQEPAVKRQMISGTIREEGTEKPIRNVNVFFDGTMNGTATDSTGNFTLYPQTSAKLPILVSGVGYYSRTISNYPLDKDLLIDLKVRSYDLDAVTVMANDGMSYAEKIRIFKREFLGTSPSAKSCEIMNEGDLRFTYSSKTHILKATCDKPLVIRNKSLGYTLNFLVSSFSYTGEQSAFYGSQFFREDANHGDVEKLKKARRNVYLGSQMHFIRSLWSNQLAENGFEVVRYLKKDSLVTGHDHEYLARDVQRLFYDSLVVDSGNQKYLRIKGQIKVTYRSQVSIIQGDGKPVLIDKNGYQDPVGIIWLGNIGNQRAGDLLPLEFNDVAPLRKKDAGNNMNIAMDVSMDTLHNRMPQEKLYIQLDKPYYTIGDTVRMKAYLLDAEQGKGSEKSGIVYVELANDSNKVLFRRMLPVGFGLGSGNIILGKRDIPEGSYTLRAYTNLMRNFGEDMAFRKNLYISSGASQNWLVSSKTAFSKISGKGNLQLVMQLNQLDRKALRNREVEIRVMDGTKVLQRDKVQTDIDGKMDVNFNIPETVSGGNLSVVVADPKSASHNSTIPIAVNRLENIDLQFMPEGGNLVTGIPSRVGFKAIGEDGNSVEVSGKVYNINNEEVASFASSYKGMGSFELKPLGTSAYTAKVTLNGTTKSFPLPTVKSTGSALRIISAATGDSLIATITVATNLAAASAAPYHLIGQSGGKIYYDEEVLVSGNTYISKGIDKNLFPTGLARFTLMNPGNQPLNERVAFIDHHDNLQISMKPVNASYKTRDSVSVAIEVKDSEDRPVQGSFSLAVTDDSQVRTDSLSTNILTSMLLTSGLKGTVEEPVHYLQTNAQAAIDLDNLLLTQGWVGYNWKDVLNPPAIPVYAPESELLVSGKVTNALNKSQPDMGIQLLSLKPPATKVSTTKNDGSFSFTGLPVAEDLKFFLQVRSAKGKILNAGIKVNEFKPEEFNYLKQRLMPWYVNSDTVLLRQISTRVTQEKNMMKGSNLLREVTITDKKIVKESKNLNGAGGADQILDEQDMAKGPKKSLLELMKAQVKGFGTGMWPSQNVTAAGINVQGMSPGLAKSNSGPSGGFKPGSSYGPGSDALAKSAKGTVALTFAKVNSYKIFDKEMHLIIDGIDVESLYQPTPGIPLPTMDPQLILQKDIYAAGDYILERNQASPNDRMNFIEQFLTRLTAEDIKGIEVMSNPQYNNRYKAKYATNIAMSLSAATADFAYVEVTTYSGNGIYVTTPPGVYLDKPVSYVNNASFYKPKYTSKTSPMPDLRSTIHWEPDILTDKDGKARVSFYSADRPGTYSIIMEGSNMNGAVGRKTGTINIK